MCSSSQTYLVNHFSRFFFFFFARVSVCKLHGTLIKVKQFLKGSRARLTSCWSCESSKGCQAWQQVPSPVEPAGQPSQSRSPAPTAHPSVLQTSHPESILQLLPPPSPTPLPGPSHQPHPARQTTARICPESLPEFPTGRL